MKKIVFILVLLSIFVLTNIGSNNAYAAPKINVIINGNPVTYTKNTGFPYLDKKNNVMVPFYATMEASGAATGYDSKKRVAIIITEHNRIEIPLNSTTYYKDNKIIKKKSKAITKSGQIFIPIKDVLKTASYTVEWDKKTSTINAYTFKYDKNEFVPYSTSSLKTLISEILSGNVIYINGSYYATPKFVKMLANTQVYYSGDDLNTAIYPQKSRYDLADYKTEWISEISGVKFGLFEVYKSELPDNVNIVKESKILDSVYVYGFYRNGFAGTDLIYLVDEMTDKFMKSKNATGKFNGIRMKKEDGVLYFSCDDLKSKKLYQ